MRLTGLLIVMIFGLVACGGDDDLPQCIQDKLSSFETEACESTAAQLGGNLVRFTFRTETVYCFNWGSCQPDKTIEIWQEDCTLLCELGGPDELTVCDGALWADFAVEDEVLFQR